jgi:hypothetical protein
MVGVSSYMFRHRNAISLLKQRTQVQRANLDTHRPHIPYKTLKYENSRIHKADRQKSTMP